VNNLRTTALRIVKNIILFQKKIFFIAYLISIVIGISSDGDTSKTIGLSFLFIAPFIQYLIYEIKNKNEYYYYYNLGLSKSALWVSTLTIGLVNLLILMII